MARKRPLVAACGVAVLLHLLGLGLAWLLWPAPRPPEEAQPVLAVELVQPQQQRVVTPTPVPPPAPIDLAPARPQPRPAAPAPSAADSPRLSLRMRQLDLTPSPRLLRELGRVEAEQPAERERQVRGRDAPVRDRLERWLREDQGRRNVQLGRAHPGLFDLQRQADTRFSPTREMIPERLRRPQQELWRSYLAGIDGFNRMGKAVPDDPEERGEAVTPPRLLAGQAQLGAHVQKHGSRRTVTEICIRAEPSRNAIIVEQRSSGVPAIDRLARRAMERALRERAMPADLGSCNACYSFVVTHGRSLPTPSLSCDLDTLKCKPPASGTLEKQVLLVWVLHDSERVSGTRP